MMIQMMFMVTHDEQLLRFVTIIRSAKFLSISTDWWCFDLTEKVLNRESESQSMRIVHKLLQFQQVSKSVTVRPILNTAARGRAQLSLDLWLVTLYITLACDLWFDHIIWGVSNISATWNWKVLKSTLSECTVSWAQLQYLYIWCRNKAFRHRIKMWGV